MARLRLLLLLFAVLGGPAHAQWQTVGVEDDGRATTPFAVVGNPAGDRFEVRRRDDDTIMGVLVLREGFEVFHHDACPTFIVDLSAPTSLAAENAPCEVDGNRASFVLGKIDEGRVVSPQLVMLMDGHQVVFRFQLERGGYRETRFPLRQSKSSLTDLLGARVQAAPR